MFAPLDLISCVSFFVPCFLETEPPCFICWEFILSWNFFLISRRTSGHKPHCSLLGGSLFVGLWALKHWVLQNFKALHHAWAGFAALFISDFPREPCRRAPVAISILFFKKKAGTSLTRHLITKKKVFVKPVTLFCVRSCPSLRLISLPFLLLARFFISIHKLGQWFSGCTNLKWWSGPFCGYLNTTMLQQWEINTIITVPNAIKLFNPHTLAKYFCLFVA